MNPHSHLALALGNITRMERGENWAQHDLQTPAVCNLLEGLDSERAAIAGAFGLSVPSSRENYAANLGADYGAYLAQTCTGCHGPDLAGQRVPGTPPELPEAANLTPHANGLAGWSEADFVKVIRQGLRPDGRELHGFMPWKVYAHMTDDELRAIWLHLSALPPQPGTGKD